MAKTFKMQRVLPDEWFDEMFVPVHKPDDFQAAMGEIDAFFKTDRGRKWKDDIRGKIFNFTQTNAYIAEGRTNVNIAGTYVVGTSPKYNEDKVDRARRTVGEQLFAKAGVEAFNAYAKDIGWIPRKDNNYSNRADAFMAVEADSCGSKGPYDNGFADTALKTVDSVLGVTLQAKTLSGATFDLLVKAVERRYREYARYINPSYAMHPSRYVEHMQRKGLSKTMRGFPFYASGSSAMKDYWLYATQLIFNGSKDARISQYKFEDVKSLTVDEFIQKCLTDLRDQGLKVVDWFNLKHVCIIPISRNQGSPFKTKIEQGKVVLTGERKDMKYRLVTPIGAFVQANTILNGDDLVSNAKRTEGRVGLMDPATNTVRMNQFIRKSWREKKVIISTDFTSYDATLCTQMLAIHVNMYANLYSDEWTKDGFICAALSLCQKCMFLPTHNSGMDKVYDQFDRYFFRTVKGIRSFSNEKIAADAEFKSKTVEELQRDQRFDFSVWAFYISQSYLPSGHFFTNCGGSDCTLCMGRTLTPTLMHQREGDAQGSGDDCIQQFDRGVFDSIGLMKTYEMLEEAYSKIGMIVNATKQLFILYKGYPIVDFLQHPYLQGEDVVSDQPIYNKFMRQFFSLIYTERRSKLGPVLQYCIVLGKGEAGSCSENIALASNVMNYYGQIIHQYAKKKRYKPRVHVGLSRNKDKLTWNEAYTIENSVLGGFEQLIGLVMEYGQDLNSQLGKYAAGKLDDVVSNFDQELETRAPHREGMAKAFYKALGENAYNEAGGDGRFGETIVATHFYFIDVLKEWLKISGLEVASVKLDEPLVGAEVMHDGGAQPDDEDASNYEFEDGSSD